MNENEIMDESLLSEREEAIRTISRVIRQKVGRGILCSRDDVLRCLVREGKFDIISVTDSGMTICAPDEPDEPDEQVTLTGYFFSSSFNLSRCE